MRTVFSWLVTLVVIASFGPLIVAELATVLAPMFARGLEVLIGAVVVMLVVRAWRSGLADPSRRSSVGRRKRGDSTWDF